MYSGGSLLVSSNDLYTYALDVKEGKRLWKRKNKANQKYSGMYASPVFSKGAVIVAGKNGKYQIAECGVRGEELVQEDLLGHLRHPRRQRRVIYVASYERKLIAIE